MQPFTRQDLEHMKRADIQRLCKDYGLKANLKTESLIELLLDNVQNSNLPPLADDHNRQMAATTSARRVSTRTRIASLARPVITQSRVASSRRSAAEHKAAEIPLPSRPAHVNDRVEVVIPSPMVVPPANRTRKAKETQYKLGVGRPAVAGGSGARTITKSRSVTRPTRTRSKRVAEPVEEAIPEELEPPPATPIRIVDNCEVVLPTPPSRFSRNARRNAENANTQTRANPIEPEPTGVTTVPAKESDNVIDQTAGPSNSQHLMDEVHELRGVVNEQQGVIEKLQENLQSMRSEIVALRAEVSRISAVEDEMKHFKTSFVASEVRMEKQHDITPPVEQILAGNSFKAGDKSRSTLPLAHSDTNINSIPSLPRAVRTPSQPSRSSTPARTQTTMAPSIPPTALGKRHRDSNLGDVTPSLEVGEENDVTGEGLARRVIRPSPKKKARMDLDESQQRDIQESLASTQRAEATAEVASPGASSSTTAGRPLTAAASDTHETPADSPPPETPLPLPEFYGDQINVGDANSFNFIFSAPTTSTPHPGDRGGIWDVQGLTFSPGSAVRTSRIGSGSGHMFPMGSSSTAYDRHYQHMLPQPFAGSSMGVLTEEPFGTLEMATVARPDDSPIGRSQYTMYGTELNNDDRFGEYSTDGVVRGMTDFWLGGQF